MRTAPRMVADQEWVPFESGSAVRLPEGELLHVCWHRGAQARWSLHEQSTSGWQGQGFTYVGGGLGDALVHLGIGTDEQRSGSFRDGDLVDAQVPHGWRAREMSEPVRFGRPGRRACIVGIGHRHE